MTVRPHCIVEVHDTILKSPPKKILHLITKQINQRSLKRIKGTKKSLPRVDSSISLMHYDLSDQVTKLH